MNSVTELQNLVLVGLIERLKSGKACGTDYSNAIKFLEKHKEIVPEQPRPHLMTDLDLPFQNNDTITDKGDTNE